MATITVQNLKWFLLLAYKMEDFIIAFETFTVLAM